MISIEMIDQTIDSHYEEKVGGCQGWPTVARVKPLEFTITKCVLAPLDSSIFPLLSGAHKGACQLFHEACDVPRLTSA